MVLCLLGGRGGGSLLVRGRGVPLLVMWKRRWSFVGWGKRKRSFG